ncbi:MAG: hypothetical protein LBQ73_09685 [Tannerellaceae bacterium]|jgi:hypothetical protein|nr:hypothetical protein [Tannerellaceae bacterium]
MKKIILSVAFAAVLSGCEKKEEVKEDEKVKENYTLSIDSPNAVKNGQKCSVSSNVSPNASTVSNVELFLDGKSHEKKFSPPFVFDVTLKDLLTGDHKFVATATLKDGTIITSIEKGFIFSVSLGDDYQGGIVIKTTDEGVHGTIASKSDLSGGVSGKYKYGLYNGNYQAYSIDDGLSNTNKFAGKYDNDYAAIACLNLELNGYDDWYLPAHKEFEDIGKFESILIQNRLENIYWTSTLRNDDTHAEIYTFGRVSYTLSDLDIQKYHYVKPCRRF